MCSRPLLLAAIETAVLECAQPRVSTSLLRSQLTAHAARGVRGERTAPRNDQQAQCGERQQQLSQQPQGEHAQQLDGQQIQQQEVCVQQQQQQQQQQQHFQEGGKGVGTKEGVRAAAGDSCAMGKEGNGGKDGTKGSKRGAKEGAEAGQGGVGEEPVHWEWWGWCRINAWMVGGPALLMSAVAILHAEAAAASAAAAAAVPSAPPLPGKRARTGASQSGAPAATAARPVPAPHAQPSSPPEKVCPTISTNHQQQPCVALLHDQPTAPTQHTPPSMLQELGVRLQARALQGLPLLSCGVGAGAEGTRRGGGGGGVGSLGPSQGATYSHGCVSSPQPHNHTTTQPRNSSRQQQPHHSHDHHTNSQPHASCHVPEYACGHHSLCQLAGLGGSGTYMGVSGAVSS